LIKFWSLITLILVARLIFAHTLKLPAKFQFAGPVYALFQQTLYIAWEPPAVGGFLEPGAIL
jgi:hypothetical protein